VRQSSGEWSTIALDTTSTTRDMCIADVRCAMGKCARLCKSGFAKITGHRVAFKPSDLLLNPDLPLAAQTLATSSFFKSPEADLEDPDKPLDSRRAFKYYQVLESGNIGPNTLWYDFAFGGWKIGVGYEPDTGLLMQASSPDLAVDQLARDAAWTVWSGNTAVEMARELRVVTTGLQRDCQAMPPLASDLSGAKCNSSADCGAGGSCSLFQACFGEQSDQTPAMFNLSETSEAWRIEPRRYPLDQPSGTPPPAGDGVPSAPEPAALNYVRVCEARKMVSMAAALGYDDSDRALLAADAWKSKLVCPRLAALSTDSVDAAWLLCRRRRIDLPTPRGTLRRSMASD